MSGDSIVINCNTCSGILSEMTTSGAFSDRLVTGSELHSGSSCYQVLSILGQGTFGKVAKCIIDNQKTVAVKMIRKEGSHGKVAKRELAVVQKLAKLDSDKCNLVQWNNSFFTQRFICLEFELLDQSLLDFMTDREYKPLLLTEIRPIVQQIANALDHLKSIGMIHADIEPDNIMLVNHEQVPFKVKLVDFGLAFEVSAAKTVSNVQSLAYSSPENILGLPFTEAIDMWSLGCVAAFLYLGTLLYPCRSEYDLMRLIVQTQGQLPDKLLSSGKTAYLYFQRDQNSPTSLWKLRTAEQFHKVTGIMPEDCGSLRFDSLDDLQHVFKHRQQQNEISKVIDAYVFVDMLKGMLHLEASKRLTPRQVLEHQFISMSHIKSYSTSSLYVKACFDKMVVCHKRPPDRKSVPATSGSYPSVRHRFAPAAWNSRRLEYCRYPKPHSREHHTKSAIHTGEKRKIDEDVSSHSKKIKTSNDDLQDTPDCER